MAIAMDTFLTTEQVAEKMKVSQNMVLQMIKRNELPATRFGKLWRVREIDLLDYLNRRYTGNEPENIK
jgi:excisionase family DNA binding protein